MVLNKYILHIILTIIVFLPSIGTASILQINIIDEQTGRSVPARVLLRCEDGQSYFPDSSVLLEIGKETWFMSPGNSTIEVPAGKTLLRIERGKEYQREKEMITISPGIDTLTKKVILRRWINMKERGYMSGENHLHRSPEDIAALCAAEDLNYGTVLQWWRKPVFDVDSSAGHIRDLNYAQIITPTSIFDIEVENDWGAFYMINNPKLYTKPYNEGIPILITAEYGRQLGTLNCYQAGWSREVLVDALNGVVDVVNVCNNNFHMHRYQPRSRYSNLLNIENFPVYPDTPQGMMDMNFDSYYRLLNCGLKLSAGAGSATGAKQVPVGYNRAYVRCIPADGLNGYIEGLREGKNFVTNGPMIFLKSAAGLMPGDSLSLPTSHNRLEFQVEVISDSPIRSIEIIVNGSVTERFKINSEEKYFSGKTSVEVNESAWIAARCVDEDLLLNDAELAEYESPAVRLNQKPNRLRFAHTSPIYIRCANKDILVKTSLQEAIQIIDAFRIFAMNNADQIFLPKIMDAISKARSILETKLKNDS
jgi:hypothetical protein